MPNPPRLAKLSVPRTAAALTRPRLHRLLDEAVARGAVFIAALSIVVISVCVSGLFILIAKGLDALNGVKDALGENTTAVGLLKEVLHYCPCMDKARQAGTAPPSPNGNGDDTQVRIPVAR
jgi:hypothetical protein